MDIQVKGAIYGGAGHRAGDRLPVAAGLGYLPHGRPAGRRRGARQPGAVLAGTL